MSELDLTAEERVKAAMLDPDYRNKASLGHKAALERVHELAKVAWPDPPAPSATDPAAASPSPAPAAWDPLVLPPRPAAPRPASPPAVRVTPLRMVLPASRPTRPVRRMSAQEFVERVIGPIGKRR